MDASIRLHLRVSPGAAQASSVGRHGPAWKLRVSPPPEDGRANEAVIGLASTLGVRRGDVAIIAGHSGRDKVVTLAGLDLREIERRLGQAAAPVRGGAR